MTSSPVFIFYFCSFHMDSGTLNCQLIILVHQLKCITFISIAPDQSPCVELLARHW